MSLSKDLARRRAMLLAADLLQDILHTGGEVVYAVTGEDGMSFDEGDVQDEAIRGLMAELETRAGIETLVLERGPRGALHVKRKRMRR